MPGTTTIQRVLPVDLKVMNFATGTWTYTVSSGLTYQLKTATDETSTITIPIDLPRKADQFGVKIKSIKIPYRCTTAALDAAPTFSLYRQEFDAVVSGATGDVAATEVTTTNDGVVTADANDRLLTITVSSPDWDYDTEALARYVGVLTLNAGATSVIRVYSPFVVYDELN